jgi:PAS domain S-box-containing protein
MGAAAAVIGSIWFALWLGGVPPRWSAQGVITMKTNMALGHVLAGVALLLLGGRVTPGRRAVAVVASALVLVTGAMTLAEHLFLVDLRIDQLLATEPPGAPGTAAPNRMGPPGAMTLTVLGAGLLTLAFKRRGSAFLGAAGFCLVLVPTVGMVYGVGELHSIPTSTGIARSSVVGLMLLSTGLILAPPSDGHVPLLWRRDAGGELLRRMLIPAALLPMVLGYVRLEGERRGLYGTNVGTGLFAVAVAAMFVLLLWRSAIQLSSAAAERQRAISGMEHAAELLDLGDAFVEVDRDWRCVRVNANYEKLSRKTRTELIGRVLWDVFPESAHPDSQYWREYRRCMDERVPVQFDEYYGPLDLWTGVSAYPTSEGGVAIFVRDVTDRKRAEMALLDANEKLREADRRKDEFLAMLSHELRNPLAPIRNSIYILRRTEADSEQAQRAHSVIERQSEHLTRLVDDLLDATRMITGKAQLRRARVDLVGVVRRAVDDYQPVFSERHISVDLVSVAGPLWVDGDPNRLAQVMANILMNAVKFTEEGGRTTVALTDDPDAGTATIEVTNTGVGIDRALLSRLFEPFTQGAQALDRKYGGLGLGLAITKALVELHGGSVTAHSEGPGQGAQFRIELPLVTAATDRERGERREAAPVARRVLIIEDNRDMAESLKEIVEMDGHEVMIAFDGEEGMAKALDFRPNVVLCDIGLPKMSGYAVARAIRANDALGSATLIALTGYASPDDRRHAVEAGFDHHFAKPPKLDQILRAIMTGRPGPSRARTTST